MTLLRWIFSALSLMLFVPFAVAQNICAVPPSLPDARAEYPPPGSARVTPLTGLVLALSWSPQFCKTRGGDDKFASQCDVAKPFGFILHGLWPDGDGPSEPRWCRRVPALSRELVRQNYCATPSVTLQQHEWAKHGSCVERDPARYFARGTALFNALKSPDMDALSRKPLDVGAFIAAFVVANPGLSANSIRVGISDIGWLEEVRLCLATDYHPRACPRDISGAGDRAKLRIWRAEK